MIKFLWRKILKPFLNLFLKSNCPLCQRPADRELCKYCERQVLRCQFPGGGQIFSGRVPVFVWGEYKDSLKRAIAAMKYNDNPQIARPLGYWLADGWLASPLATLDKVTVIPIPMHKKKLRERGFNQAELLGNSFCELTGLQLQRNGLERVKQTEALFGLSAGERLEVVKDAFVVGKDFSFGMLRKRNRRSGESVLLVDDIYTTGATVNAAIEVLQKAGIKVVGVVAIATTKKPTSQRPRLKSQKVVKKHPS